MVGIIALKIFSRINIIEVTIKILSEITRLMKGFSFLSKPSSPNIEQKGLGKKRYERFFKAQNLEMMFIRAAYLKKEEKSLQLSKKIKDAILGCMYV